METGTVSARLKKPDIERLHRLASTDRRTVSVIVAMMVEQALPEWEARVLAQAPAQPPKGRSKT